MSGEAVLPGPGLMAGGVWLIVCFLLGGVLLVRGRTLAGFLAPLLLAGICFVILGELYHPDYYRLLRLLPVYLPLAFAIFAVAGSFRHPPRPRDTPPGYYTGPNPAHASGFGGHASGGGSGGRFSGGGGSFGGGGASGGW